MAEDNHDNKPGDFTDADRAAMLRTLNRSLPGRRINREAVEAGRHDAELTEAVQQMMADPIRMKEYCSRIESIARNRWPGVDDPEPTPPAENPRQLRERREREAFEDRNTPRKSFDR